MSSPDHKHLANMTTTPTGGYTNYAANYAYDPQGFAQQAYATGDPYAYSQNPSAVGSWFNYKDSSYLKGFLVGAGVAVILANPAVQKALISGTVKCWNAVQGGVEEVKEKVKDVRAEMSNEE